MEATMPRDSSGQYSLPSGTLVNTGDTVLVSQHNPAMQDLAQSITNSLDRNGSGGMRADLAMGNNKITGLIPGVADTDAATVGQINTDDGIPIGVMFDYWGTSPPDGWLFAAGQEISRTDYADLFAAIGTVGGVGNGSTTFNLPDCRGRVVAGKDNMGGTGAGRMTIAVVGTTLGSAGGNQVCQLTANEMPAHTHSLTGPTGIDSGFVSSGPTAFPYPTGSGSTTGSTGGGAAHNNTQPTIICNKIIKVTA